MFLDMHNHKFIELRHKKPYPQFFSSLRLLRQHGELQGVRGQQDPAQPGPRQVRGPGQGQCRRLQVPTHPGPLGQGEAHLHFKQSDLPDIRRPPDAGY